MNPDSKYYVWEDDLLVLKLYIQPNAKQEGFDGLHDERIKLRISAPATDGRANQKLVKLLAEIFAVPKRSVALLHGEKSRNKVVSIQAPRKLPNWVSV